MQACLHRTWSVFADKYRMLLLFASSDTCHRPGAVSLAADLRSRPPISPKHQVCHMTEPYRFPIPLSNPTARLSKPRPTDFSHQIQWHVCRLEYLVVQKRKRIQMVVRMSSCFNPRRNNRETPGPGRRNKLQAGSGEIHLRSVPPIGMIVDPAPHGDETLRPSRGGKLCLRGLACSSSPDSHETVTSGLLARFQIAFCGRSACDFSAEMHHFHQRRIPARAAAFLALRLLALPHGGTYATSHPLMASSLSQ
jgi:hypothetical protein